MTIKTPPKKYKIYPAYINSQGFVVHEGEYLETEIDINEARLKSTAVLVNASDFVETKPVIEATENTLTPNGDILFQNTSTVSEIKKLKINSAAEEEIENLKYVGKATVQKIVAERQKTKITSYQQLDSIAPIKGGKLWKDIAVIDFENQDQTKGLVYEGLQTFGYNAENINASKSTD